MARGPRNHLKRLNAPKTWFLDKLGGVWAPRPSAGPHALRESLPIIIILRNRLKYALTRQECQMICMEGKIQVDKKVRADMNFPTGFMDVVELPESKDCFRVLYDTKRRFALHPLDNKEANFKLCRVQKQALTKKAIPYIATHDGRTIRYPNPDIKVNDTIKLNLKTGKVEDFVKMETGNICMVTKGRNTGRVGILHTIEKHPGSFTIVHIKDVRGNDFVTRLQNVFIIGKGDKPWISLPKGEGVKKNIFEEEAHRIRNQH